MANALAWASSECCMVLVPGFLLRGLAPIAAVASGDQLEHVDMQLVGAAQVLPDQLGQR